MTVGPVGDLRADQWDVRGSGRTTAAQAVQAERADLDRQAERHAQLAALREAQLRADEIPDRLEAFGIQRAHLPDQVLVGQICSPPRR